MTRAAGEGTLYQDDRGRWIGMASAGINPKSGKRRRIKLTGKPDESKASVARRLRDRIAELESTSTSAPETVGEMVMLWRRLSAPRKMSPTTLELTDILIRVHILPVFDKVRIGAVTPNDVEAFLQARAETHARSTLKKLRGILKQSWDFAVKRRDATWNPAAASELPEEMLEEGRSRALTAAEAKTFMNVAERHRNGAWVVTAMTLGLRPGEASGLTWEAVDFTTGVLTVSQALSWPSSGPVLKETKTKNVRVLDMPVRTVEALSAHRVRQAEERLLMDAWPARWRSMVFVSTAGTPLGPNNLRRWFRQLSDEAELGRVTPADMRTTATSLISEGGMSAERLADMLGHKDTRMVFKHYRQPVKESISTAAEHWDAS